MTPMMAENVAQNVSEAIVSDPQHHGEGRQKSTSYKVDMPARGTSVRRRYSDFQWLYAKLVEERPGAIVPIIPHKTALRGQVRFSEELISERLQQLQIFLSRIVKHAELQDAPCLETFLSAADEDFEAAKKGFKPQAEGDEQQGTGIGTFIANAAQKARVKLSIAAGREMEKTPDDVLFEGLDQYISHLEAHIKALAKESTALVKASKDSSSNITKIGQAFAAMGEQRYPQAYSDPLKNLFADLSQPVSSVAHVEVAFGEQEEARLEAPIHAMAREVQACRIALQRRKEVLWDYTNKVRMTKTIEDRLTKGKATEAELETVKKEALDLWNQVEVVSKRVYREIDVFRNDMLDRMTSCMHNYTKLQMEHHSALENRWSKVLPIVPESKEEPFSTPPVAVATPMPSSPPPSAPPAETTDDAKNENDGPAEAETKLI